MEHLNTIMLDAAAKLDPALTPLTSTPNNSLIDHQDHSGASSSSQRPYIAYSGYAKRSFPKFTGKPRAFARWYSEWTTVIHKMIPQDVVLVPLINDHTPQRDDVLHCDTVEEAFEILHNRYGNPHVVCTRLMDEWKDWRPNPKAHDQRQLIEVDTKFTALIGDLKAVNQEKQLTNSDWMCQHTMKILPRIYKEMLMDAMEINSNLPLAQQKTIFVLVKEFLKRKRTALEVHGGWFDDDSTGSKKNDNVQDWYCRACNVCHPHNFKCTAKPRQRTLNALTLMSPGAGDGGNNGGNGGRRGNEPRAPMSPAAFKEAQDKIGPCPVCQGNHSYTYKGNTFPSSRLSECQIFMSLDVNQRLDALQRTKSCTKSLSWKHGNNDCRVRMRCNQVMNNGSQCRKKHHSSFHGERHAYLNAIKVHAVAEVVEVDHHAQNACCVPEPTSPVLLHI